MALKSFRPLTASLRFTTLNRPEGISKERPERSLVESKSKTGGRNTYGRITSRRRGGGHKKLYRIIDFKRSKLDMAAKVQSIEYDPNRTALLALLAYADGTKTYVLAPQGLKAGDTVFNLLKTDTNDFRPGNSFPLGVIPPATKVHAVELLPGRGPSWPVPPAPRPSSSPSRTVTPRSASAPAKPAWSTPSAAPPSARFPTPTTASAPSAKPAATAGSASARACAASP